jgi:3-phenylpropionate/trans-cinnamate dioxygenase ferredoxin reductase subunit
MPRTIVVVGAGLGGLRVAEQLRSKGWEESIIVVGDEPHPPYNRPPLTKLALRGGVVPTELYFRQRASTSDVEWLLGHRVTHADFESHTLTLADNSALGFDGLVISTGVRSRRLPLDAPMHLRHTVRTIEDAQTLHDRLTPGARVLVIGGGFIGCEVAGTASELGCRVSVVEPNHHPLEGPLGALVGGELRRRLETHGITFELGQGVSAIDECAEGVTKVLLSDGSQIEADVIVEAVGSVANTEWLRGQTLDLTDGVLCDGHLHPQAVHGPVTDVVVVGDVARAPISGFGATPHRIEHWATPTETAGHAAASLLRGLADASYKDGQMLEALPTFWSDQCGTRIQSFGMPSLGRDDVRILEGDVRDQAAIGYYLSGGLVGIVLIGLAKQRMRYRQRLLDELKPLQNQEIRL